MITRLEFEDFGKVSSLFEGPHLRLHIDAVVEGNSPGRIWVDDAISPRSAYMWDMGYCHYFVGREENGEFEECLGSLLAGEIIPQARARGFSFLKAYYTRGFEDVIGEMFGSMQLRSRGRIFHSHKKLHVENSPVPDGFRLVPIDGTLLFDGELRNISLVREEISSCWTSLDRFLERGFGFCVRRGDEIAGWCTAEYRSGTVCGIGIETVEAYGGRGLATAMASSLVGHCLSSGIAPHWDSWSDNLPSLRVAEKVGFEKVEEYSVYAGSF